jgi:hypothetical protein
VRLAPARRLLGLVTRTRVVNKALAASLSPSEVEALPLDIVDAAIAFITERPDNG